MIPAFDDPLVIAGQGSLGCEILDEPPDLDTLVVPIGGGGLASGIAIAIAEQRPSIRIIGVQASACAPWAGKTPAGYTIADGIAVKQPGELTRAILGSRLDQVPTLTHEQGAEAIL